jgi:hypothetical protein
VNNDNIGIKVDVSADIFYKNYRALRLGDELFLKRLQFYSDIQRTAEKCNSDSWNPPSEFEFFNANESVNHRGYVPRCGETLHPLLQQGQRERWLRISSQADAATGATRLWQ